MIDLEAADYIDGASTPEERQIRKIEPYPLRYGAPQRFGRGKRVIAAVAVSNFMVQSQEAERALNKYVAEQIAAGDSIFLEEASQLDGPGWAKVMGTMPFHGTVTGSLAPILPKKSKRRQRRIAAQAKRRLACAKRSGVA